VVTLNSTPCFAAGTRILTERGEVTIESLKPGDRVLTWSGETREVHWIGHRRVDLTRHPDPALVLPVRIASHAVAENKPYRDLLVSPDHALFVDGMLIPARLLVNGASIGIETKWHAVTYYHVELENHDILFAEGLPAESYLDTGNRAMFENGGEPLRLHPDFSGEQRLRQLFSRAPVVSDPARVEPVWRMLARRSTAMGRRLPEPPALVDDPDPYILLGTRRIRPVLSGRGRYAFAVPDSDTPLRLITRAARPCDIHPWVEDRRLLGIMVRRLSLRTGTEVRDVPIDGPLLERGWWAVEWQPDGACRWTNGNATLPPLGSGVLEVEVAGTMRYRVEDTAAPDRMTRRARQAG